MHFYNWLLAPIPFGKIYKFKIWYLRKCGVVIGKNSIIGPNVLIRGFGSLIIGDNVEIRHGVCIECGSLIKIGNGCEVNFGSLLSANCGSELHIEDDVRIAHNVSLKCSTHKINFLGKSIAGDSLFKNIVIGAGSWLCAGCIILPGVKLGRRNIVAAGAVVTHDTPDNVLMAGVPAILKKNYSE